MTTLHRIPASELTDFVLALVEKLGTPPDIAQVVARTLVNADLTGHTSHGVMQIPNYLNAIEHGRLAVMAWLCKRYGRKCEWYNGSSNPCEHAAGIFDDVCRGGFLTQLQH
mgnify:CR=1 FL=1